MLLSGTSAMLNTKPVMYPPLDDGDVLVNVIARSAWADPPKALGLKSIVPVKAPRSSVLTPVEAMLIVSARTRAGSAAAATAAANEYSLRRSIVLLLSRHRVRDRTI